MDIHNYGYTYSEITICGDILVKKGKTEEGIAKINNEISFYKEINEQNIPFPIPEIYVIMKKCFLEEVYSDLPVIFVDNWSDITEEFLKETVISFSTRQFDYSKLNFSYWMNRVMSKFN